jgi:hypothetical protein
VSSKKLGKACLNAMMRRVVESGERARGAQELLKLGRVDEAMDVATTSSRCSTRRTT